MHFSYAITSSRCSHDHAIFQSVRSPPPIPETARCLPCKRLAGELDGSHGRIPPINIFQQGHDFVAVIELPGVRREDLSIEAKDGTIRVSGKKTLNYGEGVSIHRRERLQGAFDRPSPCRCRSIPTASKRNTRTAFLPSLYREPKATSHVPFR